MGACRLRAYQVYTSYSAENGGSFVFALLCGVVSQIIEQNIHNAFQI